MFTLTALLGDSVSPVFAPYWTVIELQPCFLKPDFQWAHRKNKTKTKLCNECERAFKMLAHASLSTFKHSIVGTRGKAYFL